MQAEKESRATEPLVTVIIPSYNHERYISQSIESVFSQSYKNVELIVIDDGSKDQSLKIINNLADKYGFVVIARENRGLPKTLNEGIGLAHGKYICFLASDDYYLPLRIEHAVMQLERSAANVALVYCDGYFINDESQKMGLFGETYPRPIAGSTYNNLLVGNWIPAIGVTYKADVLKLFMFDERFKIEDYALYLRMFKNNKYELFFYMGLDFAYRWHGGNTSKPGELMKYENGLIQSHFEDVGRYAKFKQQLKTLAFGGKEMLQWKNYYLLCLHAIRKLPILLKSFFK